VNKFGIPNRPSGLIEWKNPAKHVTSHAGLLLAFCDNEVEVRSLKDGELMQSISAPNVRCLSDGRNAVQGSAGGGEGEDRMGSSVLVIIDEAADASTQRMFELMLASNPQAEV
jgi:hypothetical protein